ncbi:MAG: hypothetical protein U0559_17575 [Anaerolineae bacterium]
MIFVVNVFTISMTISMTRVARYAISLSCVTTNSVLPCSTNFQNRSNISCAVHRQVARRFIGDDDGQLLSTPRDRHAAAARAEISTGSCKRAAQAQLVSTIPRRAALQRMGVVEVHLSVMFSISVNDGSN